MILEGTIKKGNLVISQADAKALVADLSRAIEEAADHQMSCPVVTIEGNSEKERITIWVSPK